MHGIIRGCYLYCTRHRLSNLSAAFSWHILHRHEVQRKDSSALRAGEEAYQCVLTWQLLVCKLHSLSLTVQCAMPKMSITWIFRPNVYTKTQNCCTKMCTTKFQAIFHFLCFIHYPGIKSRPVEWITRCNYSNVTSPVIWTKQWHDNG